MIKFASLVLLAGVLTILSFIQNSSQNVTFKVKPQLQVINNLQEYGIEIIKSEDPNFKSVLDQYIGDKPEVSPLLEATKGFNLIIKNNSKEEIVGISLRWKFTDSDGNIRESKTSESNPGVLIGMKPRDPFLVGKTSLINKNSTKFFSYFGNISSEFLNLHKSVRSKRIEYNLSPQQIQDHIASIESEKNFVFKNLSDISVSVDSVIFKDGTFIGENQNLFFEEINGILQARKNFLRKLKELSSPGKSESNILSDFISEASKLQTADPIDNLTFTDQKAQEAFNKSFIKYTGNLVKEIERKRNKRTDGEILKEFLDVKDSDVVILKKI